MTKPKRKRGNKNISRGNDGGNYVKNSFHNGKLQREKTLQVEQ